MLAQRSYHIVTLCLIALVLQSCITEYELKSDRTGGILTINGRITNDNGPQYVTLSRTSEKNRITEPDSGAEMELHDDQGNVYPLYQEEPGTYVLPAGSAQIFPGYAYRLRIELRGNIYETPFQMMKEKSAKDSIGYKLETDSKFNRFGNEVNTRMYNVYLTSIFQNKGDPEYFKWEAKELYAINTRDQGPLCYRMAQADPQRINIQEAASESGTLATEVLIASRRLDDAFLIKYYTIVDQYNISREEYEYWRKVKLAIEQAGSIFDVPPGTIRGNVANINDPNDIVYGYFSVSLKTSQKYFIEPSDLPEAPTSICVGISLYNLPGYCKCQDGIIKPDFF